MWKNVAVVSGRIIMSLYSLSCIQPFVVAGCVAWTWMLRSLACNTSRRCSVTPSAMTRLLTGKDARVNWIAVGVAAAVWGFPSLCVWLFTHSKESIVSTCDLLNNRSLAVWLHGNGEDTQCYTRRGSSWVIKQIANVVKGLLGSGLGLWLELWDQTSYDCIESNWTVWNLLLWHNIEHLLWKYLHV